MEGQGIGPVRGPRVEHTRERAELVAARVDREHAAPGQVEPRDHQDLLAGDDTQEPLAKRGGDFYKGLGCALAALPGRLVGVLKVRPDPADGNQGEPAVFFHALAPAVSKAVRRHKMSYDIRAIRFPGAFASASHHQGLFRAPVNDTWSASPGRRTLPPRPL
jgi:hypothetical protein